VLGTSSDGHELTAEELDAWVASFPIELMETVLRPFILPADMQAPAETARNEVL
jgi:hypothetical protein